MTGVQYPLQVQAEAAVPETAIIVETPVPVLQAEVLQATIAVHPHARAVLHPLEQATAAEAVAVHRPVVHIPGAGVVLPVVVEVAAVAEAADKPRN